MRKAIVLAVGLGLLCVGSAWANDGPDVIQDKALLGYWQFNDSTYKKDSGPWGNDIVAVFPSGMSGIASGTASAGYDGSGYLHLNGGSRYSPVKISVSTSKAPAWNNTVVPYYTILARFKSSKSYASSYKSTTDDCMNDTSKWHFLGARYQVGGMTGSDYKYMFCCDPDLYWNGSSFWSNSSRPEDGSDSMATLPVSVSSSAVTIGGNVGSSSYYYEGDIDDVIVVNRMMAKNEITRCFLTGETYVYATGNPAFFTQSGWSSSEGSIKFAPGDIPGQAYIIDSGRTLSLKSPEQEVEFGGTGFTGSLTLGRLEPLVNRVGGTNLITTLTGNFTQYTNSTRVTFGDLRLRNGKITAGHNDQTLTTRSLRVDATASDPFTVYVNGTSRIYTINAGGAVTGSGVVQKTGSGTLVLNDFDAANGASPKFRMTAGFVKTGVLHGYTGGTVIVADGSTTTVAAGDMISAPIQFKFETTPTTEGAHQVFALSDVSLDANAFSDKTTGYPSGWTHSVRVENGKVYVDLESPVEPIIAWTTAGGTDVGANIDKMKGVISLKYMDAAAPEAGTYLVQTIGGTKSYTANNFTIDWNGIMLPDGCVPSVVVTDGKVYVKVPAVLPAEDKGAKPVLLWQ